MKNTLKSAQSKSVEVSVSNRLPIHTSYKIAWVDNLDKIHIISKVYHCDI